MYEFNYYLLEHLDEITGISRAALGQRSGKSKDFMRHVLLESHDIKVSDLMDICNAVHISVGCFFTVQGTEPITKPEPVLGYSPAKFDVRLYNELMKGKDGKYRVQTYKIMHVSGCEDCRRRRWAKDINKITARTLVALCNAMCIDMRLIISCPMKSVPGSFSDKQFVKRCEEVRNQKIDYEGKYKEVFEAARQRRKAAAKAAREGTLPSDSMEEMTKALAEIQQALAEQQRQIEALREASSREVSRVNQENEELKAKIAQLQQENRELRQELPGTGLAADGTAPYVPEKK